MRTLRFKSLMVGLTIMSMLAQPANIGFAAHTQPVKDVGDPLQIYDISRNDEVLAFHLEGDNLKMVGKGRLSDVTRNVITVGGSRFVKVSVQFGVVAVDENCYIPEPRLKQKPKPDPCCPKPKKPCCTPVAPTPLRVTVRYVDVPMPVPAYRPVVEPRFYQINNNNTSYNVAAPPAVVQQRPPIVSCPYCGMRPRYVGSRAFCPNYGYELH